MTNSYSKYLTLFLIDKYRRLVLGPVLGGILTLAWGSETVWYGACLSTIYSLGLGIPFLVIGAASGSVAPLLKRIQRYSTATYIFDGILLMTIGILILANRLMWF